MAQLWNGTQAQFGGMSDDYGPCSCGNARATVPVAIPAAWFDDGPEAKAVAEFLEVHEFPFALGYGYRRVFGDVDRGDGYFLNYSACPECCQRAAELGLAEEVEDVGFSTNPLTAMLLEHIQNMFKEE